MYGYDDNNLTNKVRFNNKIKSLILNNKYFRLFGIIGRHLMFYTVCALFFFFWLHNVIKTFIDLHFSGIAFCAAFKYIYI